MSVGRRQDLLRVLRPRATTILPLPTGRYSVLFLAARRYQKLFRLTIEGFAEVITAATLMIVDAPDSSGSRAATSTGGTWAPVAR